MDIDKFDYIIQNPFFLLVWGIVVWFAGKFFYYAYKVNKQNEGKPKNQQKKPSFHDWSATARYSIYFTLVCLFIMIAWDDEFIDHFFTGRTYEQFSDSVYLLTGPVAATIWYIISHFNELLKALFDGAVWLLTKLVRK